MATDLKPLIGLPLPFGAKSKRGAEPAMGRMQSFFLNMLREHDPEYRQLTEELESQAKRIQDYLDSNKESLISVALQMAVPSSSRRRKLVSDGGAFGGYFGHDINEKLDDGVRWQDAAMWTVRASKEPLAEIAGDTGWPVATVEKAITTLARTIGYWKLLDEEGRLK